MKLESFAIFVLLFLFLSVFSEGIPSGWSIIHNNKDQRVLEIAQFAVTEQQKQTHIKLSLVEVISGEIWAVAEGLKFRLVLITANNGSVTKKYQAQVIEQVRTHNKILDSFVNYEL